MIRVSRAADNDKSNDKERGAGNNFYKTENRDLFWKIHIDYLIGKETHLLLPSIYNFLMALIFYLALVVFMYMSYLFDYTINS